MQKNKVSRKITKNRKIKKTPTVSNVSTAGELSKNEKSGNPAVCALLFVTSLFLFSLLFFSGESLWQKLHETFLGLFGVTSFLWPFLFMYASVVCALKKENFNFKKTLICGAILIFFVCTLFCLIFNSKQVEENFFCKVADLYDLGKKNRSSGAFSGILGIILLKIFGKAGSRIIVALTIFVLCVFFFNANLGDFFINTINFIKNSLINFKKIIKNKNVKNGENFLEPVKEEQNTDTLNFEEAKVYTEKNNDNKGSLKGREKENNKNKNKISAENEEISSKNVSEDGYEYPPVYFLKNSLVEKNSLSTSKDLKAKGDLLIEILKNFSVKAKIINISKGPAVTRYELQPACGTKISKITNLADDIALNLAALDIRIEAPIPGKSALGIEVPNRVVNLVRMQELINSKEFLNSKSKLTVVLGKDIEGKVKIADLAKMPHILIAGSTGSGKSVCINSFIVSLLYKSSPSEVKFIMIDPKVVELGIYNGIPHLMVPVVTDPRKASNVLGWAVVEMLKRYKLFAQNNVRDLTSYNNMVLENKSNKKSDLEPLPQVVIIIDELADLMMASPKEVEDSICRLAQMARAAGMHLVIATQRPSVNVITGVIKANIPSRIALAVSSQVDSRTILDSCGAEKLLGRGDMLFSPIGALKPTRIQGCFVSEKEIESVIEFIKVKNKVNYNKVLLEEMEKVHYIEDEEKPKKKKYFRGRKDEDDF